MRVCVFAASSSRIDNAYLQAAGELGTAFAREGVHAVFGGGGIGLMGILADNMLAAGGKITGVIPEFMIDEGWGHAGVSDMIVTADMSERKKTIFAMSDAAVALPGGVGTLEELTEVITLKQLGQFNKPIIIVNVNGFYDHLIEFFDYMFRGNFIRLEHKDIWQIVTTAEEVVPAILNYTGWHADPKVIAKI
ncbi:MAG: TIGR00730 family Rossman fold protein [Bacteroidales bacterium]|nr:TIGR00730 family Rossman fold protein [Bacteroidales bacterium]MDT8374912.1 TIGR00730 family Rossman fold protein [Bacteroidales bacterium]